MPVFNAAAFVGEALDSVLAQTRSPDEVIVIDDGSTDATPEVLERYGAAIRVIHRANAGAAAARNAALAAATGTHVAFIDADDFWFPTKLERQLGVFAEDATAGVVHTGMVEVDASGRRGGTWLEGAEGDLARDMLLFRPALVGPGSGVMVRREVLEDLDELFDESMEAAEDWDFFFRLVCRAKVRFVPEVLWAYRQHGANRHRNIPAMEEAMLRAFDKAFRAPTRVSPLENEAYGTLHRVLAGSFLHAGSPRGFLRNSVRAVVRHPPSLRYYLAFPRRRLTRAGRASTTRTHPGRRATARTVCPCCGADASALPGFEASHLARCRSCRFVFARLRPSEQAVQERYESYGRRDFESPITRQRYLKLLSSFETYRRRNVLLDVGCGVGHFLAVARELGWQVSGTEITDEAISICRSRGIQMARGMGDLPSGSVDVVTCFEVLEHLEDPRSELAEVRRVLRAGGVVYCTTPNFDSLARHVLGPRWNIIDYPEHLSYFNERSLTRLGLTVGFSICAVETTGISPGRLLSSVTAQPAPIPSRHGTDERLRTALDASGPRRLAKQAANRMLSAARLGDTLKVRMEAR